MLNNDDDNNFDVKKGDAIVRYCRVWEIINVKKQKNIDGKMVDKIFFQPYYKCKHETNLLFSLPIKNIKNTLIRKPIAKKVVKKLLKTLSDKPINDIKLDINKAKDELETNDYTKVMNLLQQLSWRKKNKPDSFTKSKANIYKEAIKKITEETAYLYEISLPKAKKKIGDALNTTIDF